MSVDRLVCCFPLCGRGVIVGGLRTANGFTASMRQKWSKLVAGANGTMYVGATV